MLTEKPSFFTRDLNQEHLRQLIEDETDLIYNSLVARNKRTRQEVRQMVAFGKPAELYLVEKCGFTFAPDKYDDLISPDGEYVEVKAWASRNIPKNLLKFQERCRENKYLKANTLFIFARYDSVGIGEHYIFDSAWKWNEKRKWWIRKN